MRILIALCLLPLPALAQVTTNDNALSALKPATPANTAAAPASDRKVVHHTIRKPPAPAPQIAKPGQLPAVPAGPPPNPVFIPPPPVIPVHPKPLPPPVPIKADAVGESSAIPGGMRLTFGPGSSDLNQANDQTLLNIAKLARLDPALYITINAWAPGTNEDPSTPRRLSLDRALAARAVLINAGIVSDRIYAVAKGFLNIEGGPPDRVDIILSHPHTTPAGKPTLPPPPTVDSTPPQQAAKSAHP
jgi:outer membrane protein OmpA-like peptidoglycan-associated protein